MIKKRACFLFILLLSFMLTGCWNYRGLDEMTIVAGVAIDKNPENGNFLLTFEFVDISGSIKDSGPKSKLIESEGVTIFDACRNAKKRVQNKLYFGHTQLLVISQDIARNENMCEILDFFLRDGECRETMSVAISQEPTASDILAVNGLDQAIISIKAEKLMERDNAVTASTMDVELYAAYEMLRAEGRELALSALHKVVNDGEPACEVNGLAVFKGQRLAGFLSPEETKYFLFAIDSIKGGLFPFSSQEGGKKDATLEIYKSKTKRALERKNGPVSISIRTDLTAYLGEFRVLHTDLDEKKITELETTAAKELQGNINGVIKKVQSEYGADIFGFGNMIYKRDFALWNQLKDSWDSEFKSLEVEVQAEVHISSTSSQNKS